MLSHSPARPTTGNILTSCRFRASAVGDERIQNIGARSVLAQSVVINRAPFIAKHKMARMTRNHSVICQLTSVGKVIRSPDIKPETGNSK
jgi:hypothetical protein